MESSNNKEQGKIAIYKCRKCELKFVENDGDLCSFCLRKKLGTVAPKKSLGRTSICFNCLNPVDAYVCDVCPECGWFICYECGSCGCNYRGNKK